jgi:alkylhydroperoxidase family enzyme
MGTARDVQDPDNKMYDLDNYMESNRFTHREKIALRYCDAIMGNPLDADDELWELLHEEFTEPELVELGYYIGFKCGAQRWIITLGTRHGELADYLGIHTPTPKEAYEIRYGRKEKAWAD